MKGWRNKELAVKSLYLFFAFAATILFWLILSNIGSIYGWIAALISALSSFIIGFAIAYILNPSYSFFREKVFGKMLKNAKPRLVKVLSILTLYIIVFGLLIFLMYIVVPQFIHSIVDCVNNLIANYDSYYKTVNSFVTQVTGGDSEMLNNLLNAMSNSLMKYLKEISTSDVFNGFDKISSIASSIVSSLFSVIIGNIISIYMLYNKEKFCAQIKKTGYAFLSKKTMYKLQRWFGKSHLAFGQYLTGVIIDALIVGCEFTVLCAIFRVPYAPLIGVVLGITNMIPFFGPYIGGIPCAIIVLVNDPWKVIILLIMMLVVQQIDGNLVAPKIIGQKTGLDAVWVIFAILVGGYFFGVLGMLLAVPVFSVVYLTIRDLISDRLEKKGMSVHTKDYLASANVAQKYNNDEE